MLLGIVQAFVMVRIRKGLVFLIKDCVVLFMNIMENVMINVQAKQGK